MKFKKIHGNKAQLPLLVMSILVILLIIFVLIMKLTKSPYGYEVIEKIDENEEGIYVQTTEPITTTTNGAKITTTTTILGPDTDYGVLISELLPNTEVKYDSYIMKQNPSSKTAYLILKNVVDNYGAKVFNGLISITFSSKEPKRHHKIWYENNNKIESYEEIIGYTTKDRKIVLYWCNFYNTQILTNNLQFELVNYYHISEGEGGIKSYNCHFKQDGTTKPGFC